MVNSKSCKRNWKGPILTFEDQNEINESTRAQLEAINTALAELQVEHRQQPKRKPIGFIQPEDDKEETK